MLKYYHIILVLLLFFDANLYGQVKEYKLLSKAERSDFNYQALNFIDTTSTRETRRKIFNPVKGSYTVYTFMATFKGISFANIEKEFHDILIVKVDKGQKIIDAFQYTLEWAEPPLMFDLYKATAKGVIISDKLPISKLKFRGVEYSGDDERELKDQGVLVF